MWMKLSNIRISSNFANTTPRPEKMAECRNYWNENRTQDRPLVVNHHNYLIDGYIQYLVLKENGIEDAVVVISNTRKKCWERKTRNGNTSNYKNQPTTYVYGKHVGKHNNKEYVWRVPKKWVGWTAIHKVGDVVYVNTEHGNKPIVITRIETLSTCPVNLRVKKVCRNK